MAIVNLRIEDSLSIDYLMKNLMPSFLLIINLITWHVIGY